MAPNAISPGPAQKDAAQSQQVREFDRWRVTVELLKRMQDAGYRCELLSVSHLDKQ